MGLQAAGCCAIMKLCRGFVPELRTKKAYAGRR